VPLKPGRYQVRMAVREGTRSLVGSTSQWLDVPDTRARPLTLSSVFLLADSWPGSTDLTDVQVEKAFHPAQGLHYVVHVYAGGAGAALPGCVLQAQVWQGSRLVGVTQKHELSAARQAPAAPATPSSPAPGPSREKEVPSAPQKEVPSTPAAKWSERIALQGFAPGAYELRVLVTDRDGKPAAQRRVSFHVE
jgi:hypothetical protein